MNSGEGYMKKALELARKGEGLTSPNPLVGAVLVNGGEIVGKGYHSRAGAPHAEIEALHDAGEKARGSELYVNLEPCCHYGRTPPCTEAITRAGVKKVVVAMKDPNPQVAGQGVQKLEEAGLEVICGTLEKEARKLNEAFIKHIQRGVPFVILKTASTLDGKIATRRGDTRWITGEASRLMVHRLRNRVDGILVGIQTVLQDDPRLTTRLEGGRDAARVIVDSMARLPPEARVVTVSSDTPTLLAVREDAPGERLELLRQRGVEVIPLPAENGKVSLSSLVEVLGRKNMNSLLVEGGGTINYSFLEKGLADKIYAFIAPLICGGIDAPTSFEGGGAAFLKDAWRLSETEVERCGEDLLLKGYFSCG